MAGEILQPCAERLAQECTDAEYLAFLARIDPDDPGDHPAYMLEVAPVESPPRPSRKAKKPVDDSPAAQLRRAKAAANREKWEMPFLTQLRTLKIPEPIRNYRYAAVSVGWDLDGHNKANAGRFREMLLKAGLSDWRIDFAWPDIQVAVEIEGAPGHGRHTTPAGFTSDCVKYGEATLRGWRLLRFTGSQVKSGYAINLTYRLFKTLGLVKPAAHQPSE